MDVGIIIPCFNEAHRLNINQFRIYLNDYTDFHLCFVNDGSQDETLSMLNKFQKEFSDRITVIDMKKNQGKSAAIRAGVRYYYSNKNVSYIVYLDADLSSDYENFNELLEKLKKENKLNIVFDSRNKGNQNIRRDFLRKLFSILIVSLLHLNFKTPFESMTYELRNFKRSYVTVLSSSTFTSAWIVTYDLLAELKNYYKKKNILNYLINILSIQWNTGGYGTSFAVKKLI
jgi:glycosyltransferase involved in cell wall biosynthesis